MNISTRLVFVIGFTFASIVNVNANVILSLDPPAQTSYSSDIVSVSIIIADLGHLVPLSLSAFDLNIEFDPSVLSYTGYSLFDQLGDVGFFDAEDFSLGEDSPGFVNISEVSYLPNSDLWNLQPSSFVLAELFFSVNALVSTQTTNLSFESIDLVDVNGDTINISAVNNASITATVSSPASLLLMSMALIVMFVRQKNFLLGIKNLNQNNPLKSK